MSLGQPSIEVEKCRKALLDLEISDCGSGVQARCSRQMHLMPLTPTKLKRVNELKDQKKTQIAKQTDRSLTMDDIIKCRYNGNKIKTNRENDYFLRKTQKHHQHLPPLEPLKINDFFSEKSESVLHWAKEPQKVPTPLTDTERRSLFILHFGRPCKDKNTSLTPSADNSLRFAALLKEAKDATQSALNLPVIDLDKVPRYCDDHNEKDERSECAKLSEELRMLEAEVASSMTLNRSFTNPRCNVIATKQIPTKEEEPKKIQAKTLSRPINFLDSESEKTKNICDCPEKCSDKLSTIEHSVVTSLVSEHASRKHCSPANTSQILINTGKGSAQINDTTSLFVEMNTACLKTANSSNVAGPLTDSISSEHTLNVFSAPDVITVLPSWKSENKLQRIRLRRIPAVYYDLDTTWGHRAGAAVSKIEKAERSRVEKIKALAQQREKWARDLKARRERVGEEPPFYSSFWREPVLSSTVDSTPLPSLQELRDKLDVIVLEELLGQRKQILEALRIDHREHDLRFQKCQNDEKHAIEEYIMLRNKIQSTLEKEIDVARQKHRKAVMDAKQHRFTLKGPGWKGEYTDDNPKFIAHFAKVLPDSAFGQAVSTVKNIVPGLVRRIAARIEDQICNFDRQRAIYEMRTFALHDLENEEVHFRARIEGFEAYYHGNALKYLYNILLPETQQRESLIKSWEYNFLQILCTVDYENFKFSQTLILERALDGHRKFDPRKCSGNCGVSVSEQEIREHFKRANEAMRTRYQKLWGVSKQITEKINRIKTQQLMWQEKLREAEQEKQGCREIILDQLLNQRINYIEWRLKMLFEMEKHVNK